MTDEPVGVDLPVTKTLGRYELLHVIGRGGMAVVYLARQIELDRFVAIKELGSFHASDPTIARRFLRESRLAGSFAHTNIVTVFDYFEHGGTPYIAMEYIEGGSLRPYVASMTLAQIGGVLEGTLAGLAHAEERNIVHRDLKPENIMVTVEGRAKIADFGIAKATDRVRGASVLTQTGMTVGTPMYMAPEQAMGQEIGTWTDLYSIGCMAFEFFAGRVPFDDEAPMAILLRHINDAPPSLASVVPDVDPLISQWVGELLAKDPTKRPESANEAWVRFEEILLGLLGPRWRREARLESVPGSREAGLPLTPAPFRREPAPPGSVTDYKSFDWVAPPDSVPGPATPPPHNLPPGPLEPGPIDVPVGPPTPDALEIVEAELDKGGLFETFDPPVVEPTPEDEFKTFDVTPPQPPERDLATPPGFHRSGELCPEEPVEVEPEPELAEAAKVEPATPLERAAPDAADTMMPRRPRDPVPEPETPGHGHRTGLLVGGGIAAVVAVGAVIAMASGGPGASSPSVPTAAPTQDGGVAVAAGPLRLATPGGWEALDELLPVKGLELTSGGGAAPAGDPDRGVVLVGIADRSAHRSDLLPPNFVASLGLRDDVTPERTAVKLGPVPAYRYADLRPIGFGRSLTVYVAPTSAGVAAVACVRPAAAVGGDAFAVSCDRIAGTLALTGGATPFALGASPQYGTAIDRALASLTRSLRRDRGRLRSAGTPSGQAGAANAIATDYRRGRAALAGIDHVSPADQQSRSRLVGAVGDASKAWGRVAAAANRERRSAYGTASRDARRAESRLATALTALRRGGYDDLIESRYRTATIPSLKRKKRAQASSRGPAPQASVTPTPTVRPGPDPNPTPAPPAPDPTSTPPKPDPTSAPPEEG